MTHIRWIKENIMAIIKCPECGGQISSTVKNCVHCGCKITVCPDCGRVYNGEINSCIACGASLNGEDAAQKNIFKDDNNKIEEKFNKDAKTKKTVTKICKTVNAIGFLFCIAVSVYGYLKYEDLIAAYFLGENWNYSTWKSVFIFSVVLFVLAGVVPELGEDILTVYIRKSEAVWLKEEKIDYEWYIRNERNMYGSGSEIVLYFDDLRDAAFLLENEKEYKYDILRTVFKSSFILACAISAAVWIVDNFNSMFAASMLGVHYDFDFNLPSFYSAIVFLCLIFVVIFLFWLTRSKRKKSWETKRNFN